MYNIMIIENGKNHTELLDTNLRNAGYGICGFSDVHVALDIVDQVDADLILMDLMLYGTYELNLLEDMRKKKSNTPIVILSSETSETEAINALMAGADDFIASPCTPAFINAKLSAILRRIGTMAVNIPDGIHIDADAHKVYCDQDCVSLTQKEYNLLSLFMSNLGKTFTRRQLLSIIWNYLDTDLATRTIDAHIATLRKKLGKYGAHIRTVPKVGYIWEI